jgi:hypothetical protein
MGERAYIVVKPYRPVGAVINPELNTPILTEEVADYHFKNRLTPITVYPETISGNPLRAPCVVRYVLNFPGLLGGDERYSPDELCVAYSDVLAETVPGCEMTIFFPVSDPRVFRPGSTAKRGGSCFYAGKYKYVHRGELFEITKNSIEVTRDLPASQTPEQIANLFRKSDVFYTYDNTALAIEATLCGCPVVFLPNQFLEKAIAARELGTDGVAWGTSFEEVERARSTVARARERYLSLFDTLEGRLEEFVEVSQRKARLVEYKEPLSIPQISHANAVLKMGRALEMLKIVIGERGAYAVAVIVGRKIRRGVAQGIRRKRVG